MKRAKNPTITLAIASMRRANYNAKVADMREGRVVKAHTFADRKKVQNKNACRGRVTAD